MMDNLILWMFVRVARWLIFGHVREIAKIDYYLRLFRPFTWNNSTLTGRIFMKFGI
jgi:hypothetical protein